MTLVGKPRSIRTSSLGAVFPLSTLQNRRFRPCQRQSAPGYFVLLAFSSRPTDLPNTRLMASVLTSARSQAPLQSSRPRGLELLGFALLLLLLCR